MPSRTVLAALSVAVSLTVLVTDAGAQQRRRSAGGGEGPPPAGPSRMRVPYTGAWEGTLTMRGAGAAAPVRLGVVFELADTTTGKYTGTTLSAGNARTPHLETVVTDGGMQWKERGDGDVVLLYTARLVAADSLVGTVTRRARDGAAEPTEPAGTFVLVRRRSPARSGG